jgi:hypothetical protein
MTRSTGLYPDDPGLLVEAGVGAGVFSGRSDVLQEFVREYFEDHVRTLLQTFTDGGTFTG